MKFDMTRCSRCGSEILMGLTVCPNCGGLPSGGRKAGPYQPGLMLAVGLSAAVLLIFNWIKSPQPVSQPTTPPSVVVPPR